MKREENGKSIRLENAVVSIRIRINISFRVFIALFRLESHSVCSFPNLFSFIRQESKTGLH